MRQLFPPSAGHGLEILGWSLLESFWQMGLLTMLHVVITDRNKRFTAAVRHNIACALAGTGFCWFLTGLLAAINNGGHPLIEEVPAAPAPAGPGFTLSPWLDAAMVGLACLYLMILLFRGMVAAWPLLTAGKKQRRVVPEAPPAWAGFVAACRREMGITVPVVLRWSSGPGLARTYGFLKPVIFFPFALLAHLTTEQVEAILVHEMAHIRRDDFFIHLAFSFFRFVFFFNPFARYFYQTICRERELACDDLVLSWSYAPATYALALLKLEEFRQDGDALSLGVAGTGPQQLADRIRRITGMPQQGDGSGSLRGMLSMMLLAALGMIVLHAFALAPGYEPLRAGRTAQFILPAVSMHASGKIPIRNASPVLSAPRIVSPAKSLTLQPGSAVASAASHPGVFGQPVPGPRPARSARPSSPAARPGNEPDSGNRAAFLMADGNEVDPSEPPAVVEADGDGDTGAAFAGRAESRDYSYEHQAPPPVPSGAERGGSPYIPSTSFSYVQVDTVPEIALELLRKNKPAVVLNLGKWKALKMQESISASLSRQIDALKRQAAEQQRRWPAREAEIKKSIERMKQQLLKKQAEVNRLITALSEDPVIYI